MTVQAIDVSYGALAPAAGSFARLVSGALDMVHVRGVASPELVASLLELPEPGLPVHPPGAPHAGVRMFGRMIAPTGMDPRGPSLERYRADGQAFEQALAAPLVELRTRLMQVLAVASGLPARVPEGYFLGSVRRMPTGCGAPLHRDAYPQVEAYRELRQWCDLDVQLSWYLQLQLPQEGGGLRVYPTLTDQALIRQPSGWPDEQAIDQAFPWHRWRPEPGDLLLHAGSARWHRVEATQGPIPRHTLGGFCAWSADHSEVLSWA